MSTTIPARRIQLSDLAQRQYAAMRRLSQSVSLDRDLANLLHVRASPLNRCAFRPDMHWKGARAHFSVGELGQLVFSITTITAWNPLMIAPRPSQVITSRGCSTERGSATGGNMRRVALLAAQPT